ncbi:MAG: hypothetical protein NVS3B21_18020 [Acidimicrobiales bacterium]
MSETTDTAAAEETPQESGSGGADTQSVPYAVLDYLARSSVDDQGSVRIEVEDGPAGQILRLHVAQDDMGKVIGKRGRVAQSIRTLVRAAGAREGVSVNVDIVD